MLIEQIADRERVFPLEHARRQARDDLFWSACASAVLAPA
jgi:hypothetical protein